MIFIISFLLFVSAAQAQTNGSDLAPADLWWSPTPVYSGNFLNVGFRVKNIGNQPANPFHILLTKDNAVLCGFDAPALSPNQMFERGPNLLGVGYSNLCNISSAQAPGYSIKLLVDDTNLSSEINENNNATSAFITVIGENKKAGVNQSQSFSPIVPSIVPSGQFFPLVPKAPENPEISAVPEISEFSEEPFFKEDLNLDFLKGIVPCGTSYTGYRMCTVCDFYKLIQNIINFILFVSAPLAMLMAMYVAFLFFFSGGSPKIIQDAKSKLWLLVWGIAWILGSWLVLNTIVNIVANPAVFPKPWNQVQCSVTVSQPSQESTTENQQSSQTPPVSSTVPPITKATLSEQDARNQLQQAGISVNKGACPTGVSYQSVPGGCTSLEGIKTTNIEATI